MGAPARAYGRRVPRVASRFQVRLKNHRPSDRDIVDDLHRVARACGRRSLSYTMYAQRGAFGPNTVTRRFGSWNAALAAAKLPILIDRDVSDRALFENLARVWRKLGRQPIFQDLVKSAGLSRYAARPYVTRFGSWNKALIAFAAFAKGKPVGRRVRTAQRTRTPARPRKHSPRRINARLRSRVLIRDNCQCRMCGISPLKDPAVTLQVDHILPWSRGGRTVLGNLQTLCAPCNGGKGDLMLRPSRTATRLVRSAGGL